MFRSNCWPDKAAPPSLAVRTLSSCENGAWLARNSRKENVVKPSEALRLHRSIFVESSRGMAQEIHACSALHYTAVTRMRAILTFWSTLSTE